MTLRVESFLAVREECGFCVWAALVRIDGEIAWSYVDVCGRLPRGSIAATQYRGAVEIPKHLRALQGLDTSLAFYVDSKALTEQLADTWSQQPGSADLDRAIDLVRGLGSDLQLRYCSRHANEVAHMMISIFCRRYGVHVRERHVRR